MLQKSRSKTTAKLKYLVLIPLMMAMLTYVACSEGNPITTDTEDLSQYTYKLKKGEDMTDEIRVIHNKYEAFLRSNPGYVSWATIDYEVNEITYTVHSIEEKVPEGYTDLKYFSPDVKSSYISYMNLKGASEPNLDDKPFQKKAASSELAMGNDHVPFALIDEVPLYPGCNDLGTNEERKKCTSEKIQEFVLVNFNTALGKKLGLTGTNRIIAVFKISSDGDIKDVRARAPHPDLEVEAKRVVEGLPQMIPGKQDGQEVNVSYSLPIVFQVSE